MLSVDEGRGQGEEDSPAQNKWFFSITCLAILEMLGTSACVFRIHTL